MRKLYGLYFFITICAVLFAYRLGAWQQGAAQQASRCLKLEVPEQDQCLKDLAANVEQLYIAIKALSEQKRE